MKTLTNQAIKN